MANVPIPGHRSFTDDEIKGLHVGLLLFGRDFFAIREAMLPDRGVEEVVEFYCSRYRYSKAHAQVQKLQQQGFQPGSLVSGNMRIRVLQHVSTASGRELKYDKVVVAQLKAYDACTMPLINMVKALIAQADAPTFARAVYGSMGICGVETGQMVLSELYLDWDTLAGKMAKRPTLFNTVLWPALSSSGWSQQPPGQLADAAAVATAASSMGATVEDTATSGEPKQQQQQSSTALRPLAPASAADSSADAVYVPPATTAAEYQANAGCAAVPCRTPEAVIDLMRESGQNVPPACIEQLRKVEFDEAVAECMLQAGKNAPHRHVQDPSVKRPGTPQTSRRFMCANCGLGHSTVWRQGNAGLTLCNACGMFYNKHDHEHRPEHLIASARAKHEAQAAAAAAVIAGGIGGSNGAGLGSHTAAASPPPGSGKGRSGLAHRATPETLGHTDQDSYMSDDAGSVKRRSSYLNGSDSGEDEENRRRPRRRRRAQVNKWLAGDDYLMLDGPLRSQSNPDLAGMANAYGAPEDGYGSPTTHFQKQHPRSRFSHSPAGFTGASHRPGNHPSRMFHGNNYRARSCSVDPEYYGALGGSYDGGAGGYDSGYCQDDYGHSGCPQRGRTGYRRSVGGDDYDDRWEAQGEGLHDAVEQARPTEDVEELLSRVLIHSPTASDSSAAEALVTMSQSCISPREHHRLQAAVSSDMRAASASPAPMSRLGPAPPANSPMPGMGGSPLQETGSWAQHAQHVQHDHGHHMSPASRMVPPPPANSPMPGVGPAVGREPGGKTSGNILAPPSVAAAAADRLAALPPVDSPVARRPAMVWGSAAGATDDEVPGFGGWAGRAAAAAAAAAGGDLEVYHDGMVRKPAGVPAAGGFKHHYQQQRQAEQGVGVPQDDQQNLRDDQGVLRATVGATAAVGSHFERSPGHADAGCSRAVAKEWPRGQAQLPATSGSSYCSRNDDKSGYAEEAGAWYAAGNEEHSSPLQDYGGCSDHDADGAGYDAAGGNYYYYRGSSQQHGNPYQQYDWQDEYYYESDSGSRSASPAFGVRPSSRGGSRSASPQKRQQGVSAKAKRHVGIDEGQRGRAISRFGAEHKQQMSDLNCVPTRSSGGGSRKNSPHPGSRAGKMAPNTEGQRCANCGCDSTCLWRRDKADLTRTLCNACGIYKTNNGIDRPTNGLFPSWKNGKERVIRRTPGRHSIKPYTGRPSSADGVRAQRDDSFTHNRPGPSVSAAAHFDGFAGSPPSTLTAGEEIEAVISQVQQTGQGSAAGATGVSNIHPGALRAQQLSGKASMGSTGEASGPAVPVVCEKQRPHTPPAAAAGTAAARRAAAEAALSSPAAAALAGAFAPASSESSQPKVAANSTAANRGNPAQRSVTSEGPAAQSFIATMSPSASASRALSAGTAASTDSPAHGNSGASNRGDAGAGSRPQAAALSAVMAAAAVAARAHQLGGLNPGQLGYKTGSAPNVNPGKLAARLSSSSGNNIVAAAGGVLSPQLSNVSSGGLISATGGSGSFSGSREQQQQQQQAPMVGNVQQLSELGVLGHLIHQAWAHAVRMNEPVMLPTGHKIFPDGTVVQCQVNNELGIRFGGGSRDLAAMLGPFTAAAFGNGSGSGAVGVATLAAGAASKPAGAIKMPAAVGTEVSPTLGQISAGRQAPTASKGLAAATAGCPRPQGLPAAAGVAAPSQQPQQRPTSQQ